MMTTEQTFAARAALTAHLNARTTLAPSTCEAIADDVIAAGWISPEAANAAANASLSTNERQRQTLNAVRAALDEEQKKNGGLNKRLHAASEDLTEAYAALAAITAPAMGDSLKDLIARVADLVRQYETNPVNTVLTDQLDDMRRHLEAVVPGDTAKSTHTPGLLSLVLRELAALRAQKYNAEQRARDPDGYASPMGGGEVIRFTHGEEWNGHKPLRAVPYWTEDTGVPVTPTAGLHDVRATLLGALSEKEGDATIEHLAKAVVAKLNDATHAAKEGQDAIDRGRKTWRILDSVLPQINEQDRTNYQIDNIASLAVDHIHSLRRYLYETAKDLDRMTVDATKVSAERNRFATLLNQAKATLGDPRLRIADIPAAIADLRSASCGRQDRMEQQEKALCAIRDALGYPTLEFVHIAANVKILVRERGDLAKENAQLKIEAKAGKADLLAFEGRPPINPDKAVEFRMLAAMIATGRAEHGAVSPAQAASYGLEAAEHIMRQSG